MLKNFTRQQKHDILVLAVYNLIAVPISLWINANLVIGGLLFFGIPAIYLFARDPNNLKNILFASLTFGVILGFFGCFAFEINNAWNYGDTSRLLFPTLYEGYVPLDVLLWGFMWGLYLFSFYEHFLDRKKLKSNISQIGIITFLVSIFLVVALLFIYKFNKDLLISDYAYLKISIGAIMPFVLLFYKKYKVIKHSFLVIPFFAYVYFAQEIVALKLNHWGFPGQYIGWVPTPFGVSFPVEELIFWIGLCAIASVLYYEEAFDNGKN